VLIADTTWPEIERLRSNVAGETPATLLAAAQQFSGLFLDTFSSIVLARVFLVLPYARLPAGEREFAKAFVSDDARLVETTPVLSLLATRGRQPEWNDRERSQGHRAIPLLDHAFVRSAPMIAKLLADLEIELPGVDEVGFVASRRMLGGLNGTFYVQNAQTTLDSLGRAVIPAQDFVTKHQIRTVFGMGGAYLRGELALAILFTTEELDRLVVDRFPSLISNFKMATARLVDAGHIYAVGG
jgi:hypothetical protein